MKTINGVEMQDFEVANLEKVSTVSDFIINWVFDNEDKLYDRKIQLFNSRNIIGDYMENIYFNDGVMIDFCENGYMEVFGLTENEFKMVCSWCELMEVYKD